MMAENASPLSVIDAALPQVQQALRKELADLVASGATIGRSENDVIVGCGPDVPDLKVRRDALLNSLSDAQPTVSAELKSAIDALPPQLEAEPFGGNSYSGKSGPRHRAKAAPRLKTA